MVVLWHVLLWLLAAASWIALPLLLLTALFLILLVLIQRGKGGGLAGAFGGMGGQSAFGTKAGDTFTRITIVVAVLWIFLCVVSVRALTTTGGGLGVGSENASLEEGLGTETAGDERGSSGAAGGDSSGESAPIPGGDSPADKDPPAE
jgi:preprotein translocase subunit SecG